MEEYILKSYYGDIFFEFALQNKPADAIILLPGFPSKNFYDEIINFFYKNGYNVFFPRYRGTYQSKGKFLETNIVGDLSNFVKQLNKGKAKDLWDGKEKHFRLKKKILVSGSFGGAIACGLAAYTKEFSKLILAAPVWDFNMHNKDNDEQDLHHLTAFVKKAYQNLYRFDFNDIQKALIRMREINFLNYSERITVPILVLHDPKDKEVSIKHIQEVKKSIKNLVVIKHSLGHGLTIELLHKFNKDIEKFIRYG